MSFVVKNNAESTVADNPLAQAATTLNVAAGEGANFPATSPFLITVWDEATYPDPSDDSGMEIIECTARTTDAITIVRAQEGTADVAHALGTRVAMLITAGIIDELIADIVEDTTPQLGADLDPNNHGFAIGSDADGDLYYRASGILARLAKGTGLQGLRMNAGATAPEWAATNKASIWLGAEGAYLPDTNPAALVEVLGATTYGGWSYLAFDDTTSEHAIWRVPMPDYDGGNIVVTAFSKPATTPGGAVTLQYNILTIGLANSEAFNAASTSDTGVNISQAMNTTELNTDICKTSATIDPANVAADDLMVLELSRDVASDNLTGDGQLVGLLIEYTKT